MDIHIVILSFQYTGRGAVRESYGPGVLWSASLTIQKSCQGSPRVKKSGGQIQQWQPITGSGQRPSGATGGRASDVGQGRTVLKQRSCWLQSTNDCQCMCYGFVWNYVCLVAYFVHQVSALKQCSAVLFNRQSYCLSVHHRQASACTERYSTSRH